VVEQWTCMCVWRWRWACGSDIAGLLCWAMCGKWNAFPGSPFREYWGGVRFAVPSGLGKNNVSLLSEVTTAAGWIPRTGELGAVRPGWRPAEHYDFQTGHPLRRRRGNASFPAGWLSESSEGAIRFGGAGGSARTIATLFAGR